MVFLRDFPRRTARKTHHNPRRKLNTQLHDGSQGRGVLECAPRVCIHHSVSHLSHEESSLHKEPPRPKAPQPQPAKSLVEAGRGSQVVGAFDAAFFMSKGRRKHLNLEHFVATKMADQKRKRRVKLAKFSAKLAANFRRSLKGDFRASFAGENRQKHFPPKLHRKFHHQTSLRGSGLCRALKMADTKGKRRKFTWTWWFGRVFSLVVSRSSCELSAAFSFYRLFGCPSSWQQKWPVWDPPPFWPKVLQKSSCGSVGSSHSLPGNQAPAHNLMWRCPDRVFRGAEISVQHIMFRHWTSHLHLAAQF